MDGYGKPPAYRPLQNQPPPPAYGGVSQAPYQPPAPPYPQHQAHNVVVVQQPPVVTGVAVRTTYPSDNYLTLSIVMTIMCFVFGCWPALLCTVPAIVLSTAARDAQVRGNMEDARRKRNISLFLNIFGSTFWVVIYVIAIIAVSVSLATTADNCGYNYYYNYYYDTYYYYYYCY